MKYSKSVIAALVLLSLFSSACLVGAYTISTKSENNVHPVANQQIKEGLKNRINNLQQQSLLEFSNPLNYAFNDFFPSRDYFDSLHRELNSIFEEQRNELYELNSKAVRSSSFMVENTDTTFKVSAILQNVTKEMLNVTVNKGFLVVKASAEDKDVKKESKEKAYSKFEKVLKLPRNVDATKAETTYKDGVLVITFPKTELKEDKPIELKVN